MYCPSLSQVISVALSLMGNQQDVTRWSNIVRDVSMLLSRWSLLAARSGQLELGLRHGSDLVVRLSTRPALYLGAMSASSHSSIANDQTQLLTKSTLCHDLRLQLIRKNAEFLVD